MVSLEVRLVTPSTVDDKTYRKKREKLEKLVGQMAQSHKLELGMPSAICQTDMTIDYCLLIAKREEDVDLVADKLAAKLSKWKVSDGVKIVFTKRIGDESPETFVRNVLPTLDPEWVEFMRFLRETKHGNDSVKDWPARIQYLAKIADRYYAWGGNDVVSVFPNAKDLHEFVKGLSKARKAELLAIAKTVANRADHLYIMDWYMEPDVNLDWPRVKALYFLALLERLRAEGVFKAHPKGKGFIHWGKMSG